MNGSISRAGVWARPGGVGCCLHLRRSFYAFALLRKELLGCRAGRPAVLPLRLTAPPVQVVFISGRQQRASCRTPQKTVEAGISGGPKGGPTGDSWLRGRRDRLETIDCCLIQDAGTLYYIRGN